MTGACGLLGAHLLECLSSRHSAVGTDRNPWWGGSPQNLLTGDLQDPVFLKKIIREVAPEVLFHCAALTDLEACERDPQAAHAINARLPQSILSLLPPGCLFVYISTDAVFGGMRPMAGEEDAPSPCNAYGRSKQEGEELVRKGWTDALVIRTNFYGWSSGRKKTFAEWLWGALERGEPITLFEDFFFSPIYVADLAERLEILMGKGQRGLVHLGGRDRVSKSGFGMRLAELAGFPTTHVRTGSVKDSILAAPRGGDLSLDSSRFFRLTGSQVPSCLDGLHRFVRDKNSPLGLRFGKTASVRDPR